MQILTPEKIKTDQTDAKRQQSARIRDLSLEEEKLIKSVNDLRIQEREAKAEIDKNISDYRAIKKSEKTALQSDVSGLEARKVEAMKSVDALKDRYNEALKGVEDRELALTKRELIQQERESTLSAELITVEATKKQQATRETEINRREHELKIAEERHFESSQELSGRWTLFHSSVSEKETELAKRKSAITATEISLETLRESFAKKEESYQEKNREIASRYGALEITAAEISKRQEKFNKQTV